MEWKKKGLIFNPKENSNDWIKNYAALPVCDLISNKILRIYFSTRDEKGRVAALEIMIGTPAIKNLIREGKVAQIPSAIQTGHKFGMQTMDAAIKNLVAKRIVDPEVAEGYLKEISS